MSQTNFEKIKEFHDKFSRTPRPNAPFDPFPTDEMVRLRIDLITEEMSELMYELEHHDPYGNYYVKREYEIDKANLCKELADLLYVTYGFFDVLGVDADKVFAEVHRSNMSKLGENGEVIRREDGKILKGPNYSPANITPDIMKMD